MTKALLIEDHSYLESLYSLNFQVYVGLDVIIKKRAQFAIDFLKDGNKVDIIVCRATLGEEKAGQLIADYVLKNSPNIPIIFLGKGEGLPEQFPQVPTGVHLKSLLGYVAKALGITANDMASKEVPSYYPIPITALAELDEVSCEIYRRKDDSAYQLLYPEETTIDHSELQKLLETGEDKVYIQHIERLKIVNAISEEVIRRIPLEELDDQEKLAATEIAVDVLSAKLKKIGITEETVALARKNIAAVAKNVKKSSRIGTLVGKLLENQASFRFKNMQLTTFIATHIMKHIDWGTPEQEEKLAFICFFHDIALTTDTQARVTNKKELRAANLSPKEREVVEKHAQLAAELVHTYPHAPMGSDQIIRQHHGTLNGVGFSDSYGANISPLAIVLILSEKLSHMILNSELRSFNIMEAVKALRIRFTTTRFKKIIDIIETIPI